MKSTKNLALSWFLCLNFINNQVSSFEIPSASSRTFLHTSSSFPRKNTQLFASPSNNSDKTEFSHQISRTSFLSSLFLLTTASTTFPQISLAEEEEAITAAASTPPVNTYSITSCPSYGSSACISTTSVRGNAMKSYSGPWTFTSTPEKAFSTLLDILKSESNSITITKLDKEGMYIQATANRNLGISDNLEFYVKKEDNVIIYKSIQIGLDKDGKEVNDLGANKKRLERLRKMSNGAFGVMGDMGSSDYMDAAAGGSNGPLGQLKAFYGLQSGGGFEDVFD